MRISWTGAGILGIVPIFLSPCVSLALGASLIDGDLSEDYPIGMGLGLLVGGFAVGGAGAGAIGLALNRRRTPEGVWYATDRHELLEEPVEVTGGRFFAGALGLTPAAFSVGYVDAWISWLLLVPGLALMGLLLFLFNRWRDRADDRAFGNSDQPAHVGIATMLVGSLGQASATSWDRAAFETFTAALRGVDASLAQRDWHAMTLNAVVMDSALMENETSSQRAPVPFPRQQVDDLVGRLRALIDEETPRPES